MQIPRPLTALLPSMLALALVAQPLLAQPREDQLFMTFDVVDAISLGCCILGTIEGSYVVLFDRTLDPGYDEGAEVVSDIPSNAHIDAYARQGNGLRYVSLDIPAQLGAIFVQPGDVARQALDGTWSLAFDASAAGVPPGVNLDAFSLIESADGFNMLVSFDTTTALLEVSRAAQLIFPEDEDLVLTDGSTFRPYFDGSAAGIPATADLDGAHALRDGERLLLSIDNRAILGGLDIGDEDILLYDQTAMTWAVYEDLTGRVAQGTDIAAVSRVDSLLFSDDFESGDMTAWSLVVQ